MTFPRQRQQSKSVVQSKAMERALFACILKKLRGQNTQKPHIPSFRDLISKCLIQWIWRPYIPSFRDLVMDGPYGPIPTHHSTAGTWIFSLETGQRQRGKECIYLYKRFYHVNFLIWGSSEIWDASERQTLAGEVQSYLTERLLKAANVW